MTTCDSSDLRIRIAMKKDVHRHLLRSYGHLPGVWLGMAAEFLKTLAQRIIAILLAVKAVADVAGGNPASARADILWFLFVYVVGGIIGSAGELLANKATDENYKKLLIEYYSKLIGKDMAFYREHQTGSLAEAFRKHLDGCMNLVRLLRGDIVRILVSLIFPLVVLLIVNWQMGIIITVGVALQCGYVFWASNLANHYRKRAQEIYHKLNGEVADEITNIVAFKSSGRDLEVRGNVVTLANQEARNYWPRHKMTILLDLPRAFVTGLSIAFAFYIGLSSTSTIVPAAWSMVLVIIYSLQLMQTIGDLPDLVLRYDEHIARVYPTLKYLNKDYETIIDPAAPVPLVVSRGAIVFNNVRFAYSASEGAGRHPVFSGLTLSIEAGEHIGIVGASGAGKSTLVNLLMRFDDVDAGSIAIDGIDIRTVRQRELRRQIAYVPQEPLLLHRTISDNIAYFRIGATTEEVRKAAKVAHADDFIEKLERGYDTIVGERGTKLSGGQRQRIVLARAILMNAPIMIFDEATSSLDSESERIIQDALPTVIRQHTALVIAHRLSTVSHLDRIIVLKDGRISEVGKHEQLMARLGEYYTLWGRQASDLKMKDLEGGSRI